MGARSRRVPVNGPRVVPCKVNLTYLAIKCTGDTTVLSSRAWRGFQDKIVEYEHFINHTRSLHVEMPHIKIRTYYKKQKQFKQKMQQDVWRGKPRVSRSPG